MVGRVPFVDGATCDVYEDPDGRQWVAGYRGESVGWVCLVPAKVRAHPSSQLRLTARAPGRPTDCRLRRN